MNIIIFVIETASIFFELPVKHVVVGSSPTTAIVTLSLLIVKTT